MQRLLALGLALVGAPAHATPRVAPPDTFDVYIVGVRFAELTIADTGGSGNGGSRSYTIRKKDVVSNQWRAAVTAGESEAARDTAFFAEWGSPLRKLIPGMPALRAIHWSALRAVGWPDANTIREHYLCSAHHAARRGERPRRLRHALGAARRDATAGLRCRRRRPARRRDRRLQRHRVRSARLRAIHHHRPLEGSEGIGSTRRSRANSDRSRSAAGSTTTSVVPRATGR